MGLLSLGQRTAVLQSTVTPTHCEVCGASSRHALDLEHSGTVLSFHLCSRCGQLFNSTDISDELLANAYAAMDPAEHYKIRESTARVKARRAVEDVRQIVPTDAAPVVIDFGCGGGHFLDVIRTTHPTWETVGYDLDDDSVQMCQRAGLRATTDITSLPEADVVVMLDLAEHVKDQRSLFCTAAGLLKPGGNLYIHTPRRCVWDSAALRLLRIPRLRWGAMMWLRTRVSVFHLRLWSDAGLHRAVVDAGFEITSYRRELELSWPVETYIDVYVARKFHVPVPIERVLNLFAWGFVRLRLLRNKAIVIARLS